MSGQVVTCFSMEKKMMTITLSAITMFAVRELNKAYQNKFSIELDCAVARVLSHNEKISVNVPAGTAYLQITGRDQYEKGLVLSGYAYKVQREWYWLSEPSFATEA